MGYILIKNVVLSAKEYIKNDIEREYFYLSIIKSFDEQDQDIWQVLDQDPAYRSAMRRVYSDKEYDGYFN